MVNRIIKINTNLGRVEHNGSKRQAGHLLLLLVKLLLLSTSDCSCLHISVFRDKCTGKGDYGSCVVRRQLVGVSALLHPGVEERASGLAVGSLTHNLSHQTLKGRFCFLI